MRLVRMVLAAPLLVGSGLLSIWPALVNGAPLLLLDSMGYLPNAASGLRPGCHLRRTVFYPIFLRLTSLGMTTLWTTIAVQGALLGLAVYLLLAIEWRRVRLWELSAILAAVFLLTSMSWLASEIMTDFSTTLVALSGYLLLFRWGRANPKQRAALLILFVLDCSLHLSHLPIFFITAAVAFGTLRLFARPWKPQWRRLAVFPLAAALVFPVTSAVMGRAPTTTAFPIFTLARLASDGTLERVLKEDCPHEHFALCRFGSTLLGKHRGMWLIWNPSAPVMQLGGWKRFTPEAYRLLGASVRDHPFRWVLDAGREGVELFFDVKLLDGCVDSFRGGWLTELRHDIPGAAPQFESSRQEQGRLFGIYADSTAVDQFATWASLIFLAGIVALGRHHPEERRLCFYWLLFLAVNALFCATFSGQFNRLQGRAAAGSLLVALCVGVSMFLRRRRRRLCY